MKIRNGFVSNSSSSSFILGFSDSSVDSKFCRMLIEVIDSDDSEYGTNIDIVINNEQDLEKYIMDNFQYVDESFDDVISDKFVKRIYDYSIDIIGSGGIVYVGCIEYSQDIILNLIKKVGGIAFE